ncbi:MAG: HlpA protein [Phycisphaerales bacterium]|nr:HlpA protein [Phycisphaerales bacterium]
MSEYQLNTPVAMLVFNRPEQTARVFEMVRQARPPILLVVADGPRPGRADDAENCAKTRRIFESIDWPCDLRTRYAESNLGCKQNVSSGLAWVFDQVEETIVLEDDCLPHSTFFRFCAELLERYRDDPRIYTICGHNFQRGWRRNQESYHFSRYTHVWGWASWRRSWRRYDPDMKLWPAMRDGGWLVDVLGDRKEADYWARAIEMTYTGAFDTWDYQMFLTAWSNHMLSIIPNVNLITNIGFGASATHTTSDSDLGNMPLEAMQFPMQHPPFVIRDARSDAIMRRAIYAPPSLARRIRRRIRKWWA